MAELFATGRIVELILGLVVLEGLLLAGLRRLTGRGPAPAELAGFLLSGGFLLLALRAALIGAEWEWIAGWLTAALAAHLADLARRWRAVGH